MRGGIWKFSPASALPPPLPFVLCPGRAVCCAPRVHPYAPLSCFSSGSSLTIRTSHTPRFHSRFPCLSPESLLHVVPRVTFPQSPRAPSQCVRSKIPAPPRVVSAERAMNAVGAQGGAIGSGLGDPRRIEQRNLTEIWFFVSRVLLDKITH